MKLSFKEELRVLKATWYKIRYSQIWEIVFVALFVILGVVCICFLVLEIISFLEWVNRTDSYYLFLVLFVIPLIWLLVVFKRAIKDALVRKSSPYYHTYGD